MSTLARPFVHLNGTSREALQQSLADAADAITTAKEVLCKCAPHMRDYYVQDNWEKVFRIAQDEHTARLDKLLIVREELSAIHRALNPGH